MPSKKEITVFEKIIKKIKGRPTATLKKIVTDGTSEGADKAVAELKKAKSTYFEVVNVSEGFKIVYKKMIFGKNYEIKKLKI